VDADPAALPPTAPWVVAHGYYYNREPGKPLFVSVLAYLNGPGAWPDDGHAETLFLDPEARAGLFVQPAPGRCARAALRCAALRCAALRSPAPLLRPARRRPLLLLLLSSSIYPQIPLNPSSTPPQTPPNPLSKPQQTTPLNKQTNPGSC